MQIACINESGPLLSHLFASQGYHIQRTVHETTNQGLVPVLGCDDIIDSVVGSDILQTERGDIRLSLLFKFFFILCHNKSKMTLIIHHYFHAPLLTDGKKRERGSFISMQYKVLPKEGVTL